MTLRTKSQKLTKCFSDLMSGRFAPLGITWMASGLGAVHQHSCRILRRGDAAVLRIIPIVMKTVTMKMLAVHSIQEVGANASGQAITWPASTRATAMIFIALKNSDAVRWRKVILFYLIHTLQAVVEQCNALNISNFFPETAVFTCTSFSQQASQSVSQSVGRSVGRSISQSVIQSINQSINPNNRAIEKLSHFIWAIVFQVSVQVLCMADGVTSETGASAVYRVEAE